MSHDRTLNIPNKVYQWRHPYNGLIWLAKTNEPDQWNEWKMYIETNTKWKKPPLKGRTFEIIGPYEKWWWGQWW